jgi:hypothetical protein
MHAPTFNKWHKNKNKNKKVTLHILTHGTMQECGLISLVVCINNKFCDIRERNVTVRSEIWSMNIRSLGFQDIREWVTLWRVILWSLGCISQTNLCQILHLLSNHLARSKVGASGCKSCKINLLNLVTRVKQTFVLIEATTWTIWIC